MPENKARMDRRTFLTALGGTAGGSATMRAMAAMGIATTVQACGSSSGSPAAPSPPTPSPPPPSGVMSPRPGDWPANVGAGKTVVILGAGIAGMTAALEMTRLGYSCTTLEAKILTYFAPAYLSSYIAGRVSKKGCLQSSTMGMKPP